MTVSYQYDVASTSHGGFIRLLFKWKGSVWKLVYTELLLLTLAYGFLSLLYRQALTEPQKRVFELVVYYCSTFMEMIPLSFMLGFYVTFTATRWWNQYMAIPWPDRLMNVVMMYVPGQDESSRMLRRTLMRYLNLSLILVLRSISKAVKRRFPTKDHLIEAGFMTKLEMDLWQSIPSTEFNTFWVPCTWFINLLREARNECRITDAQGVKLIMEEFNDFRSKCGLLWSYDWISIPLVYTQVVTLATYSFFAAALFGRQYIHSPDPIIDSRHHFDFYVPVFTVIQYFLYMGLLKVAEQLINPFGDDDEDFELNWIIDRHFKVSYLGVDTLDGPALPLVKDSYFHMTDYQLPYTAASVSYKKKTYRGSVAYMHVPHEQREMVVPEVSEEYDEDSPSNEEGADDEDPGGPLNKRSSSSLWTLLNRRSSSSGSLHQQQRDAEAGLLHPTDSTLHVYFKGADGDAPPSGQQDAKQKHLLHPPEERRRGRLGSEPSAASGQKSFLRDFFHAKPAMRVQAWTGAGGDYGSPPKRPRKPRTKVSFSADTSSKPRIERKHRSRSTSDLVAILETARKEALLSSLASMKAAMPRRKSLESSQTDVKLTDVLRRNKSLPEMNISDAAYEALLTPTPPPAPTKPVRTRTSLTSQILPLQLAPRPPALTLRKLTTPQKLPETPKPAPPTETSLQTKPTPTVLLSPPPEPTPPPTPAVAPQDLETAPTPTATAQTRGPESSERPAETEAPKKPQASEKPPSRPETQAETASPVEITLRRPRVHLPRLVVPGARRGIRLSDLTKEDEGSDGQGKSETSATSSEPSGKPSTSIGAHTKPRLRVRVVPEPEIIPLEPTEPQPGSEDTEVFPPGPAPEPLPEPPASLPSEPPDKPESTRQEKDQASEKSPDKPVTDDDKTEFVVVIQEKSDERPKQLIILPGPPDRAGSVDSLLGDSRPKGPKRRSSLDSPGTSASVRSQLFTTLQKQPTTKAPQPTAESSDGAGVEVRAPPTSQADARRQRRRRRSTPRRESVSPTSREGSPRGAEGSQESLAAAAPVHRRVPCEVLMRWQNVAPSESTEELDRPPPPPLLELPGAVSPPPRGHVRQLSRVFSHRSSSTTTSSVTVRTSTTSHSRAASRADAFIESEKRDS
ncbi:uncharacterized protein KIAA1522-like [Rhipicephalus sanguineus]|uniref:uncharacterized protein KIAA1522-like n=1 Tax=Rhipicephalus sanguineus TaxID=34632 RepID=UPI0020C53642|nr:uncharacterized protein KIAA1522-like [Rhipicephalus sanguineus]